MLHQRAGASFSHALTLLFTWLLGFPGEHPIPFGEVEDSFLRLPSLGMGMCPCPREGFWALESAGQVPVNLLGKSDSMQGEECQR